MSQIHSHSYGLLFILFSLLFSGCVIKEKPFDKAEVEKEVRTTLQAYCDAVAHEGLNGEFKFLDSSEDFFWVPPGFHSRLNFDSVATIIRSNIDSQASITFHWDDLAVYPLSNRFASYTGQVTSTTINHQGSKSQTIMLETGLLRKSEDGWKILNGQSRVKDN